MLLHISYFPSLQQVQCVTAGLGAVGDARCETARGSRGLLSALEICQRTSVMHYVSFAVV